MKRLLSFVLRPVPAVLLLLVLWAALFAFSEPVDAQTALAEESRTVPILMYHSILKDPARQGKFIVSPAVLEEDLLYLREHGYETVCVRDLAAFVSDGAPLPEKPVLLTFDDGYYNLATYVLPLLEKYDSKAVVSVVGSFAQRFTDTLDPNPNYGHLNWDEIRALADSGFVEIQNHTYDMHAQEGRSGCMRKRGESADAYRSALSSDLGRLQTTLSEKCGIHAIAFTYPYGQISPESRQIVRDLGFLATLTCFEHANVVTRGRPDTLYDLGRYNRPAGISTEAFMARVLPKA